MFLRIEPTAEVAEQYAEWVESQRKGWGYVPNFAAAFASRPDVAMAYSKLGGAIRDGMDKRLFEVATIAAARALRSTYCTAAHSKFLVEECGDEPTMRALAGDPSAAPLNARDEAVAEFARKVALDATSVTDEDVERLRAAGLSDADVSNVIFAVAARSFFTKVLDASGVQADHALGEVFDPALRDRLVVGRPIAPA